MEDKIIPVEILVNGKPATEEEIKKAVAKLYPQLTLNQYQDWTAATAIYLKLGIDPVVYCALKLNGEAGEVAEKIGKAIRDDSSKITEARRIDLCLELGDVLWYVARLADELGFDLQTIAEANQRKLSSRKERGVIGGSGDNR